MTDITKILDTHARVVEEGFTEVAGLGYGSYAISALRGGVGKSTLAFNLAYEISRRRSLLVADLCPQCNLTETIMRDCANRVTIYRALQPKVLGPAFGDADIEDISYRVSHYCDPFKGGKRAFFVPGDPELFSFPAALYQQLQTAIARSNQEAMFRILQSLKDILDAEAKEKGCDTILMDTSPFYAGGTHLAWCAAEAVIIPVRVDEHSIDSLELTLKMLDDPGRDFVTWNSRAGDLASPKIAAIVMTMAGSKSQKKFTPDSASRMYIERALQVAEEHPGLFDRDPSDVFVITDDFVSTGRISGAKSIPISQLRVGSFHTVEGKRLQVNSSAIRYQKELKYLSSII